MSRPHPQGHPSPGSLSGGSTRIQNGFLRGRRVLLVEDEYYIADDMAQVFGRGGALVIGPAGTVRDALALLASQPAVDGAVLDINLAGEWVYPVADELMSRGIPFVFATGYDESMIPDRFVHARVYEKPVNPDAVAAELFI